MSFTWFWRPCLFPGHVLNGRTRKMKGKCFFFLAISKKRRFWFFLLAGTCLWVWRDVEFGELFGWAFFVLFAHNYSHRYRYLLILNCHAESFVETFHFQFYVWFQERGVERKENVKENNFVSMENTNQI